VSLRLDEVSVRYGAATALDSVTLDLGPAETVAVVGPSGSGKSTLLRAIGGLEPLAAGRVTWDGADLANTPPHRRGFGLMFQDYALFPHRDVGGNVSFGLEMQHQARSTITQRVREVLELVGLAGFERRPITNLSGGEQQRVALARALAPNPRLLMLDEPLGALDRALRTELLDQLAALFTQLEMPIVYVTHDQEEALAVGDRVAVLRAGRLEALSTPVELWHSPPNEFVARFLGLNNVGLIEPDGAGGIRSPWGRLPADTAIGDGAATVLVRPDGVLLDPNGPLSGVVSGRSFRGNHTRLTLLLDDSQVPLEAHVSGASAPAVGESVRVRLAPSAVVRLR
jgi:thiamine transport system ATP-binding protein